MRYDPDEVSPWEGPSAPQQWAFTWKGRGLRKDWNRSFPKYPICPSCGYATTPADFIPEAAGHCFQCYMIDAKPNEYRDYWAKWDEDHKPSVASTSTAQSGGLRKLK